uniref:Uncharacterized protein n=1 Tax=Arundo donax TaxID=35708 RepID=A0A0A9C398_ARUDO
MMHYVSNSQGLVSTAPIRVLVCTYLDYCEFNGCVSSWYRGQKL